MKKETIDYNLGNIRDLLNNGFSAEELRHFCYDWPDFRPVYDQLAEGTGKDKIVHRLIEYADQKELFEPLLDWAKEKNPAKYKKHQPYRVTASPTTSGSTTHGKVDVDKLKALLYDNYKKYGLTDTILVEPIMNDTKYSFNHAFGKTSYFEYLKKYKIEKFIFEFFRKNDRSKRIRVEVDNSLPKYTIDAYLSDDENEEIKAILNKAKVEA